MTRNSEPPDPSERAWGIRAEYSNHKVQDFWGCSGELPDPALELYDKPAGFFELKESFNFDEMEYDEL